MGPKTFAERRENGTRPATTWRLGRCAIWGARQVIKKRKTWKRTGRTPNGHGKVFNGRKEVQVHVGSTVDSDDDGDDDDWELGIIIDVQ